MNDTQHEYQRPEQDESEPEDKIKQAARMTTLPKNSAVSQLDINGFPTDRRDTNGSAASNNMLDAVRIAQVSSNEARQKLLQRRFQSSSLNPRYQMSSNRLNVEAKGLWLSGHRL